jgi:hypothetical protein
MPSTSGFNSTVTNSGVAVNASSTYASSAYSTVQATIASTTVGVGAVLGSSSAAGYGVAGQVTAAGTATAAVYGSNLRTTGGEGVYGIGVQGVVGENNNIGAGAVFAINDAAASGSEANNSYAPGVIGEGFVGLIGESQTDGGYGVYGFNVNTNLATGHDQEGVFGLGYYAGVEGQANYASGYGVGSIGNSIAIGDVDATGLKNFLIDNPLDPANKCLKHTCPESNEPIDFYRGNVILDANGKATVTLPDYFSAININYSYILTAVGAAAPNLHIDKEIAGNTFSIAGGKAGLKVSWQVTSTRNDAYMKLHPEEMNAEPAKESWQKGKYFLPEAYGFGNDKAIFPRKPMPTMLNVKGGTTKQQPLTLISSQSNK